jgi:pyruvoyl-dependent arginine decarboxylase (PvlArgDC)
VLALVNVSMISACVGTASAAGGEAWGAVAESAGRPRTAAANHHVRGTLLVLIQDLTS